MVAGVVNHDIKRCNKLPSQRWRANIASNTPRFFLRSFSLSQGNDTRFTEKQYFLIDIAQEFIVCLQTLAAMDVLSRLPSGPASGDKLLREFTSNSSASSGSVASIVTPPNRFQQTATAEHDKTANTDDIERENDGGVQGRYFQLHADRTRSSTDSNMPRERSLTASSLALDVDLADDECELAHREAEALANKIQAVATLQRNQEAEAHGAHSPSASWQIRLAFCQQATRSPATSAWSAGPATAKQRRSSSSCSNSSAHSTSFDSATVSQLTARNSSTVFRAINASAVGLSSRPASSSSSSDPSISALANSTSGGATFSRAPTPIPPPPRRGPPPPLRLTPVPPPMQAVTQMQHDDADAGGHAGGRVGSSVHGSAHADSGSATGSWDVAAQATHRSTTSFGAVNSIYSSGSKRPRSEEEEAGPSGAERQVGRTEPAPDNSTIALSSSADDADGRYEIQAAAASSSPASSTPASSGDACGAGLEMETVWVLSRKQRGKKRRVRVPIQVPKGTIVPGATSGPDGDDVGTPTGASGRSTLPTSTVATASASGKSARGSSGSARTSGSSSRTELEDDRDDGAGSVARDDDCPDTDSGSVTGSALRPIASRSCTRQLRKRELTPLPQPVLYDDTDSKQRRTAGRHQRDDDTGDRGSNDDRGAAAASASSSSSDLSGNAAGLTPEELQYLDSLKAAIVAGVPRHKLPQPPDFRLLQQRQEPDSGDADGGGGVRADDADDVDATGDAQAGAEQYSLADNDAMVPEFDPFLESRPAAMQQNRGAGSSNLLSPQKASLSMPLDDVTPARREAATSMLKVMMGVGQDQTPDLASDRRNNTGVASRLSGRDSRGVNIFAELEEDNQVERDDRTLITSDGVEVDVHGHRSKHGDADLSRDNSDDIAGSEEDCSASPPDLKRSPCDSTASFNLTSAPAASATGPTLSSIGSGTQPAAAPVVAAMHHPMIYMPIPVSPAAPQGSMMVMVPVHLPLAPAQLPTASAAGSIAMPTALASALPAHVSAAAAVTSQGQVPESPPGTLQYIIQEHQLVLQYQLPYQMAPLMQLQQQQLQQGGAVAASPTPVAKTHATTACRRQPRASVDCYWHAASYQPSLSLSQHRARAADDDANAGGVWRGAANGVDTYGCQ